MLAKLKLRALVRAPIRSPNCVFTSPFQAQQERKKAGWLASRPGLLFNAVFVGELAGKRVCHGNYGPNPQKAGHLGCLQTSLVMEPLLDHQLGNRLQKGEPAFPWSFSHDQRTNIAEDSLTIHREGQQTKFSLGSFSIKVYLWTGHQGQTSLPLIPPSK